MAQIGRGTSQPSPQARSAMQSAVSWQLPLTGSTGRPHSPWAALSQCLRIIQILGSGTLSQCGTPWGTNLVLALCIGLAKTISGLHWGPGWSVLCPWQIPWGPCLWMKLLESKGFLHKTSKEVTSHVASLIWASQFQTGSLPQSLFEPIYKGIYSF